MSLIFSTNFEQGSYIDSVSKAAGIPTAAPIERTEKGLATKYNGTNSIFLFTELNCGTVYTIIQWIRFDQVATNIVSLVMRVVAII